MLASSTPMSQAMSLEWEDAASFVSMDVCCFSETVWLTTLGKNNSDGPSGVRILDGGITGRMLSEGISLLQSASQSQLLVVPVAIMKLVRFGW